MSDVQYPHVRLVDGVAMIAGTQTKVVEVVLDHIAYDWDAGEIQRQHPALTLAQIHGALAYYYDHQAELDRDIEDRLKWEDWLIASLPASPMREKLQAAKRSR